MQKASWVLQLRRGLLATLDELGLALLVEGADLVLEIAVGLAHGGGGARRQGHGGTDLDEADQHANSTGLVDLALARVLVLGLLEIGGPRAGGT